MQAESLILQGLNANLKYHLVSYIDNYHIIFME